MNKLNGNGVKRILKATKCSNAGLYAATKNESAFRQELLLVVILFPFSFLIATGLVHWLVLIGVLFQLLIVELINSAIEAACDAITLEHNSLIKNAKDIGSAAVFIALVMILTTWVVSIINTFYPIFLK